MFVRGEETHMLILRRGARSLRVRWCCRSGPVPAPVFSAPRRTVEC